MKQYTVRSGQNLYDVALTLYGSIEGVFDLLVNNDGISLNAPLKSGQVLNYSEGFMITQSIVDWLKERGVVVKNGCKTIDDISVVDNIDAFISSQNLAVANGVKNGRIQLNTGAGNPVRPLDPFGDHDDEVEQRGIYSSDDESGSWERINDAEFDVYINDENTTQQNVGTVIGHQIDFGGMTATAVKICMRQLFEAGMILLPQDDFDKNEYLSSLSIPKMLIVHTGRSCSIGLQIRHNRLLVIDWGDGSDFDYVWFNRQRQDIGHQYDDDGTHFIKIYGNSEFVNLDFTNLSGVYYPLNAIYIEKRFITPFPNAEKINKLFIVK